MIEVERRNFDAAAAYFLQALDLWSDDGQSGARPIHWSVWPRHASNVATLMPPCCMSSASPRIVAAPDISSIEFPFRAFATCVTLMRACAGFADFDAHQAGVVLKQGHDELNRRAALIANADTRRRFVENGPFHRELLQLMGQV